MALQACFLKSGFNLGGKFSKFRFRRQTIGTTLLVLDAFRLLQEYGVVPSRFFSLRKSDRKQRHSQRINFKDGGMQGVFGIPPISRVTESQTQVSHSIGSASNPSQVTGTVLKCANLVGQGKKRFPGVRAVG